MKTKTKSKSKKKPRVKDALYLELDGVINLVEVTNGKTIRNQMDSELMLKSLVLFIEKAVESYK